ncbi:hypothetical protein L0Y49_04585 [bacterium]|nr:hypothetical protein [bacterium]MCI0566117.1 hypothetical protein [bacterium]MCI0680328.1 hypothetical protein [bacterium]
MAYNDDRAGSRMMYQGDWKCSNCGKAITELPFQPSPERADTLMCVDCYREQRGASRPKKPMYQGNWACSECGKAITELPFQPSPDRASDLKCRDCFRRDR